MGDKDFVLAGDGWTPVTPCGEFPHSGAGVTQVIDREACERIAADFDGHKADANFPGWPVEAGFEMRMEEKAVSGLDV